MLVEPLDVFLNTAHFAQAGTLAGAAVTLMLDLETIEDPASGALTQASSALLKTADAAAAAAGQAVVVAGVTYTVRQVLLEPPDGVFTRLILARSA